MNEPPKITITRSGETFTAQIDERTGEGLTEMDALDDLRPKLMIREWSYAVVEKGKAEIVRDYE